jgi:hypothetical protein
VKAAPKPVDALVEAERAVQGAQVAEAVLRDELAKAEAEANKVAARFLRDPGAVAENMKVTMLRDRAKALHIEGLAAVENARAHRASVVRERLSAQHERDKVDLPKWKDALAPLHAKLAALDAALDDLVLQYARHVLDAQAAHDAALERARELGLRLDVVRPELEDAQHEATRSARRAREAAGRDCLSDWLAPELGAGDWKVSDSLTANERTQQLRHQAMTVAEDERAALVAHGVHLAAAHMAQQQSTSTEGESP